MAQKPVLRGEVGCACVAREVSVERGGMGKRGCAGTSQAPCAPGLLDALPVHALGALGIAVVVRDVGPRQVVCDDASDAAHVL